MGSMFCHIKSDHDSTPLLASESNDGTAKFGGSTALDLLVRSPCLGAGF
jgi:hypothetical protein